MQPSELGRAEENTALAWRNALSRETVSTIFGFNRRLIVRGAAMTGRTEEDARSRSQSLRVKGGLTWGRLFGTT